MPKHRPIYFKEPKFSEESKNKLKDFIEKHPVATSATKALLAVAILGGVLTLAAIAPGLTRLAGQYKKKNNERERYRILWERFNALKKLHLFECVGESKDGGLIYRFTEKGRVMAKKFLLDTLEIKRPQKWDGKWRVVVFDIPEKYKKARYALYHKLKDLDFYPLQRSVWLHPFSCEAEINFLKDVFDIHPFVEVFVAEDITNGKAVHYFQDLLKDYV